MVLVLLEVVRDARAQPLGLALVPVDDYAAAEVQSAAIRVGAAAIVGRAVAAAILEYSLCLADLIVELLRVILLFSGDELIELVLAIVDRLQQLLDLLCVLQGINLLVFNGVLELSKAQIVAESRLRLALAAPVACSVLVVALALVGPPCLANFALVPVLVIWCRVQARELALHRKLRHWAALNMMLLLVRGLEEHRVALFPCVLYSECALAFILIALLLVVPDFAVLPEPATLVVDPGATRRLAARSLALVL